MLQRHPDQRPVVLLLLLVLQSHPAQRAVHSLHLRGQTQRLQRQQQPPWIINTMEQRFLTNPTHTTHTTDTASTLGNMMLGGLRDPIPHKEDNRGLPEDSPGLPEDSLGLPEDSRGLPHPHRARPHADHQRQAAGVHPPPTRLKHHWTRLWRLIG